MSYGVKLRVWGDYACFTRPEMKVERVSYDVITPSAARGILEAIHWKPAIKWVVDRIHVLKLIRFDNIRRNELSGVIAEANIKKSMKEPKSVNLHQYIEDNRQQRATTLLRDVEYIIEAHFLMTKQAGETDNEAKHYDVFTRRAKNGQCHMRPYFGCREFPVNFQIVENDIPKSKLIGDQDLGWMLYDIDFENNMQSVFFRPNMINGIINVALAKENRK